jgi:hypothetical protein
VFFDEAGFLTDASRARKSCGKPTLAIPATPSCRKLRRLIPSQYGRVEPRSIRNICHALHHRSPRSTRRKKDEGKTNSLTRRLRHPNAWRNLVRKLARIFCTGRRPGHGETFYHSGKVDHCDCVDFY